MGACTGPIWASSKCTSSSLGKHITLHLPAEFCQNRPIRDSVMTSYPFQDGGHDIAILLPLSVFEISQSMAEILLLPVSKNKRPPCCNFTSDSDFTCASPSACHSASAYQISSKSDHPGQSYDVISIFQDGGHGIAILLPLLVFVITLMWEGRNLRAYQISARYLNPRL